MNTAVYKRLAIGTTIKNLRSAKGWTQKTLAKKVGWKSGSSVKTISKIEQGIQNPKPKQLADFARVFDVNIEDLSHTQFPTEMHLESILTFNGDLRPWLRKIAQTPDVVTVKKFFKLLHCYCLLEDSGMQI